MKALFLAALVAAGAAHAQTTSWKLATGYRAESFHTQNLQSFAQDVEQAATRASSRSRSSPTTRLFKLADIPAGGAGRQGGGGRDHHDQPGARTCRSPAPTPCPSSSRSYERRAAAVEAAAAR